MPGRRRHVQRLVRLGAEEIDGAASTQQSLASPLGAWTPYFLIFTILLLAFGSIIYNVCVAENAPTAITDEPSELNVLRIVFMEIVLMGGVAPGATAMICISDPTMGVLALVNVVAITMLLPICLGVLHDYRARTKGGIDRPIFNPGEFRDVDSDRTARAAKVPAKE
jgi:AGCS family alanine or glycine:cation symporter